MKNHLVVQLQDGKGGKFEAEMINTIVGADGAAVAIQTALTEGPQLHVGDELKMTLDEAPFDSSVEVPARVIFQGRDEEKLHYQLRIGDEARTVLGPLLNRRDSIRVTPTAESPIEVRIEGSKGIPTVGDISDTGISLLIDEQLEQEVGHLWRLPLQVLLPGEKAPLELVGIVRYRRLSGSAVLYGAQFEELSVGASNRLRRYVQDRQLEALRKLRGR